MNLHSKMYLDTSVCDPEWKSLSRLIFWNGGSMIVVQYVPCSEEEQGHLQCTGLLGRLSWTLSTLRVGIHVDCHGHFQLFIFDRMCHL